MHTIGTILDNKYELLELLGAGGAGTVYKAKQIDCNRIVAIKILSEKFTDDNDSKERWLREAKALSRLSHNNIISVYHLGYGADGIAYLAMEYVKGQSLQQILASRGKLSLSEAVPIICELANALEYIHGQGIVHRDLKPSNILMTDPPGPRVAKLIDFGLAKFEAVEQKLTVTGTMLGTPHYMSPEQCQGKQANQQSDIYSLCVCLFEMVSGRRPFDADSAVGLMYQHINARIPELLDSEICDFHPRLNEIIRKGMAKASEDRYQSIIAFKKDLAGLLDLTQSGTYTKPLQLPVKILVAFLGVILLGGICLSVFNHSMKSLGGGETNKSLRLSLATLQSRALRIDDSLLGALYLCRADALLNEKISSAKQNKVALKVVLSPNEIIDYTSAYIRRLDMLGFPVKTVQVCNIQDSNLKNIDQSGFQLYYPYFEDKLAEQSSLLRLGRHAESTVILQSLLSNPKIETLFPTEKDSLLQHAFWTGDATLIDQCLKTCRSASDAAEMARQCLFFGQTERAKKLLIIGKRFESAETLDADQTPMELSSALMAMQKGDFKTSRRKLLELTPAALPFCRSNYSFARSLAHGLAMVGEGQALLDVLDAVNRINGTTDSIEKNLSLKEVEDKVKSSATPERLVYYRYLLDMKNVALDEKARIFLFEEDHKDASEIQTNSLSCLAYYLMKQAPRASRALRVSCRNAYAFDAEEGFPFEALRSYEESLNDLQSSGYGNDDARISRSKQGSVVGLKICMSRVQIRIGHLDEARKLNASIVTDDLNEDWMFRELALNSCIMDDNAKLRSLIRSCNSIDRIASVGSVCLRFHHLPRVHDCAKKAQALAENRAAVERTFCLAYADLLNAQADLEDGNYSSQSSQKAGKLLLPLFRKRAEYLSDSLFCHYLSNLALTLGLAGFFDEALQLDAQIRRMPTQRET